MRPNDSSAANFRQWMAVHAASAAGGTGMLKAARGGPAGSAADGSLEGAKVAPGPGEGDATTGVEDTEASDDAGDVTGTGEVVVPQPARATTLSATARCRRVLIWLPPQRLPESRQGDAVEHDVSARVPARPHCPASLDAHRCAVTESTQA